MRRICAVMCVLCSLGMLVHGTSNLYVLEGSLVQTTDYVYRITLQPDGKRLDCNVALLDPVDQPWYVVEILDQALSASARWADRYDSEDRDGNRSARLNWYSAPVEVVVERTVRARSESIYGPIALPDPFPVLREALPWSVRGSSLAATDQSQCDDRTVIATADAIVAGSTTELEATVRVLSWIRREVAYACSAELCDPVYRTDALFTLQKKKGNCVSYAHLAVALLRAAGIPAVEAGGFVADREASNAGHAWIAAYFPSYGWIEFESADWMPAYREAPVTFLMPQHITTHVGDTVLGISSASFFERHEATFTISERPEPKTEVHGTTTADHPIAWVMTVERPTWETAYMTLEVLDAPEGWIVSLSEDELIIGEDDASSSVDILVTLIPSERSQPGETECITIQCIVQGIEVGQMRFEIEISS